MCQNTLMLFQSSCLYQENNLKSVQLMLEEIDVVIKFLSIFFTATTRKDDDSNLFCGKPKFVILICDDRVNFFRSSSWTAD